MIQKMAERIRELRTGDRVHSLRRIAEVICEEFPEATEKELHGNQLYGQELCHQAMKKLSVTKQERDEKWDC